MAMQWFVGVTQQGRETLARWHLENQDYGTYLPMYIAQRGAMPKIKPFLPSYIFIALDPLVQGWSAIHSTIGMRSILCSGDRPKPITDAIIDEIRARERDGYVQLPAKLTCKFKKGDRVRIKGVEALFEEPVDARRAIVFMQLLNRPHKLLVELSKLKLAPLISSVA